MVNKVIKSIGNSKIKDIITNITVIKDYMDITDIIEETVVKTPQASYVVLHTYA